MSTSLVSSEVKLKERWLRRSTRFFLRVLRGICVLCFEPPRMVREVGDGRPPEEVEKYNCIRWQI